MGSSDENENEEVYIRLRVNKRPINVERLH